ncbi:MAG TPA: choice-of-anchor R domain-containing protein [Afipia sp.]
MALARHQFTVTDDAGNVVAGAHIEVRREISGQPLAALKADRDGAVAMSNPFDADGEGFAAFHIVGGAYQIRAYLGSSVAPTFEKFWNFVGIGTSAETDIEQIIAATSQDLPREVTGSADIQIITTDSQVEVAPSGTSPANAFLPALGTAVGKKTIVDLTGTFRAHNLTVHVHPSDVGHSALLGGDTLVMDSNYQSLTFEQNSDATRWIVRFAGASDPHIARIFNGGTLTLPTSTDTLVGRATTDILTNKSINAVNNPISNLATSMFAANVVDTDVALAANSDTRIASQKATKAYVDQIVAANDAMVFKGVIDCSANPNYPAADRGWTYRVSVAGKIGGASGVNVEAGDILLCLTDGTASGTQASVGSAWGIIQVNIDGAVTLTGAQVLTNKTLTAPDINGGTVDNITSLGIRSTGAAFDLQMASAEVFTGNRKLSWILGNADRSLTLTANASIGGTNTGDQTITLTGDVTGSGTGSFVATIGANKVTLGMMAQIATATFLGRTTASTGNVEALTAAQATALLSVMAGDAGTGGTKGLVPAPGPGDFAAGKYLDAGGNYSVPAGGGGGGGLSDTDRRNALLDRMYQSKTYGAWRRVLNAFADGYKTTDGINSGLSSNVDISNTASSGFVAPSAAAATTGTFGSASAASGRSVDATNGSRAGFQFVAPANANISTVKFNVRSVTSAGSWTAYLYTNSGSSPGTQIGTASNSQAISAPGDVTWTFPAPPAIVSGTTYWIVLVPAATSTIFFDTAADAAGYASGRNNTITSITNNLPSTEDWRCEVAYSTGASNMTLVTAAQTADATVSNVRVLLEYDNTANPTLNTDLTVEVTCDGGAHWTAASLSAVGAGQVGRKVVETVDQACTGGTSFAARVKTLNNKNIPIYGLSIVVH